MPVSTVSLDNYTSRKAPVLEHKGRRFSYLLWAEVADPSTPCSVFLSVLSSGWSHPSYSGASQSSPARGGEKEEKSILIKLVYNHTQTFALNSSTMAVYLNAAVRFNLVFHWDDGHAIKILLSVTKHPLHMRSAPKSPIWQVHVGHKCSPHFSNPVLPCNKRCKVWMCNRASGFWWKFSKGWLQDRKLRNILNKLLNICVKLISHEKCW